MYDVLREPSGLTAQLIAVDEVGNAAEWRFEADPGDMAEVADSLAGAGEWLLEVSAEQEPPDALLGQNDGPHEFGHLHAKLLIPDGAGNTAEWRFEADSGACDKLADWLADVGEWLLEPSAEREAPQGLVGPNSQPEPAVFARLREGQRREMALIEEMLARGPARGRAGERKRKSR